MLKPVADQTRWSNRVIVVSSIFAGFGVAHLIDDFLFGVPAEFNLTNPPTQFLAFAFFVALTGLIALAAIESGTFRSGAASIFFSVGLIISGLVMAAVAWFALRHQSMAQSMGKADLGAGT
jgi:uncharacterized transporter YbjL